MEYCLHTKSKDLSGNGSNRSNYVKLYKPNFFALMTALFIMSIGIIALSLRISFSPAFYGISDNFQLQPVERNLALDVQDIKRKISALENSITRLQTNHSDIEKIGDSDIFCVNGHRVPNFFLIGSQKCGTTSIAAVFWQKAPKKVKGAVYCVNSENASDFCVKEPHFFDQHEDVLLHDERYVKLFPKCEDSADVVFDATPNNAAYTNRIEKFYNQAQKKEIIFVKVVCDPVKRYESAW